MMAECRQQITVNDLVVEADIHLRVLDMECRDEHLPRFANLCDPWELVGRHLGLSQIQINVIKEDYPSTEMRRIKVLDEWKKSVLSCTYKKLVEAFLRCNMTEQALNVCKELKQYHSANITCTSGERTRDYNQAAPCVPNFEPPIDHNVDDVHRNVRECLRKLDRQFSGVQRQLMNSPNVTLNLLTSCVSTLDSFSAECSVERLVSSRNKQEFFHELKKYCNVQSPDIVEDLVEILGDDQVKTKFSEFKQESREFQRKTKLKDLIGNYEGPETVPSNYKELRMKLGAGWHEKTLEDLENLRCQMSLRRWLLKMVEEGSLTVTCYVDLNSPDEHSLSSLRDYLQKQEVLQIILDKKCIFKQEATVFFEVVAIDLHQFITEISKHIGLTWKFLAGKLGFSQTYIDAMEYKDLRNLGEQIYQMFCEWKKREGHNATVGRLEAIKKVELEELLKTLREQRIVVPHVQGSAALASSLATGVRYPIQASDDSQTDSSVRPPAPTPTSTSQPSTNPASSAPPTERDFVRKQLLKRFASSTSDKSNPDPDNLSSMERRTSDNPISSPLTSPSAATAGASSPQSTSNSCSSNREAFEVGDCIQVDRPDSAPWYGVIKWIGTLPGSSVPSAGIEMECQVEGGGRGSFQGTSYFSCSDGHGLFLPTSRLKQDNRFEEGTLTNTFATTQKETVSQPVMPAQPGRSTSDPMSNLSGLLSNLQKQLGLQDSTGAEKSASAPSESDEAGGPKCLQLTIPADRAGLVIGTGGKNIREVERLTNTSIKVSGSSFLYGGENRKVMIIGSEENCKKALFLIMKNVQRRVNEHTAGAKTISIPENCVGKVIGKGGATISTIKSLSGAHDIKIDDRKTGLEAMLQTERQCHIHGSEEAIEKAEELIRLAIAGGDIVGGATFAAVFVELMKMGIECEDESS